MCLGDKFCGCCSWPFGRSRQGYIDAGEVHYGSTNDAVDLGTGYQDEDSLLEDLTKCTKYTLEELRQWYRMFMDQHPDGLMDAEGFIRLFQQEYQQGDPSAFAENVFRTYDVDADGKISFREFMMGISVTSRGSLEEKLDWTFKIYDRDGSGFIDEDEAKQIIMAVQDMQGKRNPQKVDELVERLFTNYDANKDGKLSKEEFLEAFGKDASFVTLLEWKE